MHTVYILLGSNMGDSAKHLSTAATAISRHIGSIKRRSGLYETAAWGNTRQADFLNQVLVVHTELEAATLMPLLLRIEKDMGRVRRKKNDPRIIDIDILFYDKEVIDLPDLQVPHPQLPNRRFVLVPLNALSPRFVHPVLKKTIHQLLRVCPDHLPVKKI
ncbi:MAG: 2-amino-4-hydroxy-6-hydroxymethyldihydropteridine diphosphokinase [Ferruginibacter sp.]